MRAKCMSLKESQRLNLASNVTRRQFLQAGSLAAAALLTRPGQTLAAPVVAPNRRPNLLFINVDQFSGEAVGAHPRPFLQTPNIDRLARRGVTFTQSYSADPVCCPARAAWFTGRMSSETGVVTNGLPLRKDLPDMGQWLRQAGYESVYVGKWHVPARKVSESFHLLHEGTGLGEHCDGASARACEGYLRNRASGAPFFLTVGLLNPHDICYWIMENQRTTQPPYPQLAGELPPLPPNFQYDPAEPETFERRRRNAKAQSAWSDEVWRYYIWSYYRYIEMVDGWVGRILDALEASGQADNTVVFLSADHGDGHARHRLTTKSFLYDEAVRVPMIVSCPGRLIEGVEDSTHLVSGVDLAPTWCDFAGVAPPPKMRGFSLRPLLEGRSAPWRDFVEAQSAVSGRMIRTPQYKYIAYQGDKVEQLFDMKNDPWETKNLAPDAARAATLEEHRKVLKDWDATLEPSPASLAGFDEAVKQARQRKKAPPSRKQP